MNRIINTVVLGLLLAGCTTSMQVSDSLSTKSNVLPVEGKQGWQVNQKLAFGNYRSDKVKRGWTFSYDIPFLIHFQGAKERLQFKLNEGTNWADVYCMGKATEKELPMLGDAFRVSLKDKNVFSGLIVTNYSTEPWLFLIQKNDNKLPGSDFSGVIHRENELIDIREVRLMENGRKSLGGPLGYEFIRDGESIGAVETINNGKVILNQDTDEETKMILASASAALLLRTDLEVHIPD